jgi:hypothetical protein
MWFDLGSFLGLEIIKEYLSNSADQETELHGDERQTPLAW